MKKFKWLLGMLVLALMPMLQSCDDDEGRKEALELRQHDQVDEHEAQDQQQEHLLQHSVDVKPKKFD